MTDKAKNDNKDVNVKPTQEEPAKSPAPEAETGLAAQVSDFEAILEDKMLKRETSLQLGKKLRIGLLIFVFLYCSFLYYMAASLDADTAVLMMRGQLDAELPQVKAETVQTMKESAPKVIDEYSKNVVDSIPSMRKRLENEILATTGEAVDKLQVDVNKLSTQILADAKVKMDKMDKTMTTAEKMDRLTKEMKLRLFEESRAMLDSQCAQFTSELKKLDSQVKNLQTNPNLSKKEKHQKELLRVWSKLMQLKMVDVNQSVRKELEKITVPDATNPEVKTEPTAQAAK